MSKYQLPDFLQKKYTVDKDNYEKWLKSQSSRHRKRDMNYFEKHNEQFDHTNEQYKISIHKAVCDSNGKDFYTGESLDWNMINTWDNEEAKEMNYKKKFKNLPTIDHINRENFYNEIKFQICAWSVNDAKNDLSHNEFLTLCKKVNEYASSK